MKAPAICLILLVWLCGCGHSGGRHAVPLPTGYPRIEMPDSQYARLDSLPVNLYVNAAATAAVRRQPGAEWIDIAYPQFSDGLVYLTLNNIPAGKEKEMIDNRLERISLNTAGEPGERTELISEGGWRCMMLTTRGSITTPIHLMAVGDGRILSGVFHLNVPATTPVDSLTPVVDAVSRDILTMLKNISVSDR